MLFKSFLIMNAINGSLYLKLIIIIILVFGFKHYYINASKFYTYIQFFYILFRSYKFVFKTYIVKDTLIIKIKY
jgi:hypothetical protein